VLTHSLCADDFDGDELVNYVASVMRVVMEKKEKDSAKTAAAASMPKANGGK